LDLKRTIKEKEGISKEKDQEFLTLRENIKEKEDIIGTKDNEILIGQDLLKERDVETRQKVMQISKTV